MATRRPQPTPGRPFGGALRALYRAGGAFLVVGIAAATLAWTALFAWGALAAESTAVHTAAGATQAAAGSAPSALHGPALVVNLALIAVVAGCWLVGTALVVDGYLEP